MRFTLVIDSDDDALSGDGRLRELATLLRDVAIWIEALAPIAGQQGRIVRDRNGNTVGRWRIDA